MPSGVSLSLTIAKLLNFWRPCSYV